MLPISRMNTEACFQALLIHLSDDCMAWGVLDMILCNIGLKGLIQRDGNIHGVVVSLKFHMVSASELGEQRAPDNPCSHCLVGNFWLQNGYGNKH